jgi:hypothetical protein
MEWSGRKTFWTSRHIRHESLYSTPRELEISTNWINKAIEFSVIRIRVSVGSEGLMKPAIQSGILNYYMNLRQAFGLGWG